MTLNDFYFLMAICRCVNNRYPFKKGWQKAVCWYEHETWVEATKNW